MVPEAGAVSSRKGAVKSIWFIVSEPEIVKGIPDVTGALVLIWAKLSVTLRCSGLSSIVRERSSYNKSVLPVTLSDTNHSCTSSNANVVNEISLTISRLKVLNTSSTAPPKFTEVEGNAISSGSGLGRPCAVSLY